MRKFTLLLALLFVSVMGWATQYCGETLTATDGVTTVTVTCTNPSANTYVMQIVGGDNFAGLIGAGNYCHVNDAGTNLQILQSSDFVSFDNTTKTLTITLTSTGGYVPVFYNPLYLDISGQKEFTTIQNQTFEWPEVCGGGGGGAAFDPASVDWTSSDNTSTYHKFNDQFQIAAENAANMPTGPLNIQQPAWAAFSGLYVEFPAGVSACAFDDVAVTDGTEYDGNTGAGIVLKPSALTNEITKVTVTHGLGIMTFYVHNANAGSGGGGSTPAESPYCEFEIGHEASPTADVNSFILLSIGSDGHGHTIVNIKQDDAKNSAMFDYINIVGKKDIGADVVTGGSDEMAIVFPTPTPDGSGNISLDIQWSTINWGGRWQCHVELPADATCASADPFPGTHTYCKYTDNNLRWNNANVLLTWATNASGDVVITLADGEGSSGACFRNEGFEYGGGKTIDDSWFVYSGTNHATCETASTYFTVEQATNGGHTYALRKKDGQTLPSGAVVAFFGHAFSWRSGDSSDGGKDAYYVGKYFGYSYGENCLLLDAPTNVAVNSTTNVITFDAVANATQYTALVYLDGILKHRQIVSSGDVLNYTPFATGTYQVQVIADAAGYPTSDPSSAADWNLTATPVVVSNSIYCEHALPTFVADAVNYDANLTWETEDDGSITITLSPNSGETAVFREQGMKLTDFTVGAVKAPASGYFNRVYSVGGSTVVLTLKDANIAPGQGETIYFDGYVECTVNAHSTWPTAQYAYEYGSKCSGQKHVTVAVNNGTMGSATVNGNAEVDVDAGTTVTCMASPNPGYDFVNWTKGGVVVSTNTTYQPTIDVHTDLVANFEAHRETYCRSVVTDDNGATIYMTAKKTGAVQDGTGYPQYRLEFEGMAGYAITGPGNFNVNITHVNGTSGNTGLGNAAWTFDDNTTLYPYGMVYTEFYAEDWRQITFPNHYFYFAPGGVVTLDANFPTASLINWNNSCIDEVAPVLAAPTAEALNESTIRLSLSATDDYSNTIWYHVTCAAASIDETITGASGVTITKEYTGLTAGTPYEFVVTAADGSNPAMANVSAAQNCSATPVGDAEAPVITSFTATASYGYVDLAITATDDMAGDLTYTITYGSENVDVVGAAGSETTKRIFALPNTPLSFSVVATDAASHTSDAAVANATTLTVPAAPVPTHDAAAVRSVYSNAYSPAVASTFWRANFGSPAPIAETDDILYRMTANVIVWGHNSGNAGAGNIDGLSGNTYGENIGLDVSGMKYIHFDVWCDADNQLNTVNINDQPMAIPTTRTVAGEWVSFDVDITGVALVDRQNVRWLMFHPFNTTNCLAVIDNVYFWKEPEYTRDDSWMAPGELGTVCYPQGLLFTGATMYKMAGTDEYGKFVFDEVNELEPGVPYLFEATADAIRFYATAATPAAEAGTSNGMVGTFTEITIPQASPNKYYFSGRKFYAVTARTTDLTVPANRAYVDLTEPHPAVAPKPGIRRIVFDVEGTSTITGCEQIDATDAPAKILIDGQMYILRGEKLYDATGRLVK